jgi:hypothetical protein
MDDFIKRDSKNVTAKTKIAATILVRNSMTGSADTNSSQDKNSGISPLLMNKIIHGNTIVYNTRPSVGSHLSQGLEPTHFSQSTAFTPTKR